MPDSSGHHTEIDLVKKVVIILILVNFTTTLFSYFIGQGLNQVQGSSALTKLNNIENQTNSTTTAIANSFSKPTFTASNSNDILNITLNVGIYIINFLIAFVDVIINIFILMGLSIYIVAFMLFALIPSLFMTTALGGFGSIFTVIYGFSVILIGVYGVYLITKIILPFVPFISGRK